MFSGGTNQLGTVVEFPAGGGPDVQLANFTGGANGSHPGGRLLVDASGNLFGTTLSGGAHGAGTVFEIKKTSGVYASAPTVLTSFSSGIVPSGSGNLVEDAAGDLFGTTTSSVFEVQKTGSSYAAPASLLSIPFPVGTQIGSLTIDANGDIFGTTISGGANDDGTVFEIEKTATGYASAPTTLASFTSARRTTVSKPPKNPDRGRQWRPVWNHGPEYPAWREYRGRGVRDRQDTAPVTTARRPLSSISTEAANGG